jgi:hypothetical protein
MVFGRWPLRTPFLLEPYFRFPTSTQARSQRLSRGWYEPLEVCGVCSRFHWFRGGWKFTAMYSRKAMQTSRIGIPTVSKLSRTLLRSENRIIKDTLVRSLQCLVQGQSTPSLPKEVQTRLGLTARHNCAFCCSSQHSKDQCINIENDVMWFFIVLSAINIVCTILVFPVSLIPGTILSNPNFLFTNA